MQSVNLPRILQDVNMHYPEQPQNGSTDWDSPLQESVNPINNFHEKEMECIYYPYNGVLNGLPVQESSWVATSSFQNACNSQDQEGKRKSQQEIEPQHVVVSSDESQCAQFGCLNVSSCQEIGSYYSLYFHDKSDVDVMKQQQNGTFINECDLAKLSDLGPDIISLEGSVGSDLLKVVDSEEEEDLVVDDSETESEISISDTSPCPIQSHNQSERHCMVCGLPRSHTVEANFLHVDSTFPLTFVSKTPVIIKLVEIIPSDMHPRLNFGHSLICRRCFNLIDTAENLELRLITVKQELCDFVARTQASKQSPLVEVSQPNTSACMQYNSLEIPTYSAALMAAKPQTLQMAEFQQHITAKCGLSDNIYLASRASSYFFNNTFTDKRLSCVENNAQSKIISKSSSSPGLLCNCRLDNNTGSSQFREALTVEQECQCSQTSHSSINNPEKSESKLKISQEENHKAEPTKKKFADEDITTKEVVTTNKEDSEKEQRKGFKIQKDSFQCDRCGRTYCQKFKLMNHLKKHYDDFRFRCEHCSKGYSTEWNLLLHLRCHKDIRPYLCNSCPASFLKAEELKSHLLFCIDKMYACNDCSKVFVSSQKLSEHTKSHHNKISDDAKIKKLECKVCLKRFRYPTDLINHTSSHKDDKSHRCNICGRSYKHKRHLNRHHRVSHLNLIEENIENTMDDLMVKNINSENCEQQSNKQRIARVNEKLKSEVKTAENKRICPICKKAVWKLKTHLISHSNVKGYRCGLCNVEFTLKQGLVRHMRNKHSTTESSLGKLAT